MKMPARHSELALGQGRGKLWQRQWQLAWAAHMEYKIKRRGRQPGQLVIDHARQVGTRPGCNQGPPEWWWVTAEADPAPEYAPSLSASTADIAIASHRLRMSARNPKSATPHIENAGVAPRRDLRRYLKRSVHSAQRLTAGTHVPRARRLCSHVI